MSTIAFLGLGAMGSRMAANLIAAGHDLTVWNRTAAVATYFASAHGATMARTPRDAADHADVVISMVVDDPAARSVWLDPDDGALGAMRPGAVAIESSTLTPDTTRQLAAAAAEADVQFVEAPVVGSRPQADAGALLHLVGGTPAAVEAARPTIEVNAGNVVHLGEVGQAATVKLAVNGLFAAQVAAYAETVGLLERSGLDTSAITDLLAALPITSPGLGRVLGLIATDEHAPNFPIRLVAKDLDYLDSTAVSLGHELPVGAAVRDVFATADADRAARELDISGIGRHDR